MINLLLILLPSLVLSVATNALTTQEPTTQEPTTDDTGAAYAGADDAYCPNDSSPQFVGPVPFVVTPGQCAFRRNTRKARRRVVLAPLVVLLVVAVL